jgi:hypothetical protein
MEVHSLTAHGAKRGLDGIGTNQLAFLIRTSQCDDIFGLLQVGRRRTLTSVTPRHVGAVGNSLLGDGGSGSSGMDDAEPPCTYTLE